MILNTNSNASLVHDLARLSYIQNLSLHKRVLIVSDIAEHGGFLLNAGARYVCSVWDKEQAKPWPTGPEARSIEFSVVDYSNLRFRAGLFDIAIILNITAVPNHLELLNELRRVVGIRGNVIIGAPNPSCEVRIGPEPSFQSMDYYELYDELSGSFPSVQMIGQAPFAGYAISDLGAPSDNDGISFDAGLLEGGAEEIEWFLAVCGNSPVDLDTYSVVQVPLSDIIIGGGDSKDLDHAIAETERLAEENQGLIDDAHQAKRLIAEEQQKSAQLLVESQQSSGLDEKLRNIRLECGTRGVQIESLEKDLETEKLAAEAARERAVKIAKQFDNERKANQAKQLEDQMSKRSVDIELQSKLSDVSANLRQAEARAESAERVHDDLIERLRSESAELTRLHNAMDTMEARRDELESNDRRLQNDIKKAQSETLTAVANAEKAIKANAQNATLTKDIEDDRKAFVDESTQLENQLRDVAGSLKRAEEELIRREAIIRDLLVKLEDLSMLDETYDAKNSDLAAAKLRLESMGKDLTQEKDNLEEALKKIEDLEGDAADLNHIVSEKQKQIEQVEQKLVELANDESSKQEALSTNDARVIKLEGDLQSSNWRANELEARLDQDVREKAEFERKLNALEDELAAAKGALSGTNRALREAELTLATKEIELKDSESELSEFIEKFRDLEDELAAALGALSGQHRSRVEAELTLATMAAERGALETELQEFIEKFRDLEDESAQLDGAILGHLLGRNEVEQSLTLLKVEADQLRKDALSLTSNNEQLTIKLVEVNKSTESMEQVTIEDQSKIRALELDIQRIIGENDQLSETSKQVLDLEGALSTERGRSTELEQTLATMRRDLQRLETDQDQTREQLVNTSENLATKTVRIAELEKDRDVKIADKISFENESADLTTKINELSSSLNEAKKIERSNENETTELKQALEAAQSELSGTKDHANALTQQLRDVETSVRIEVQDELDKFNDLAKKIDLTKAEKNQLDDTLKAEQSKVEGLVSELQVVRKDLAEEALRTHQAGADAARMAGNMADTKKQLDNKTTELEDCSKEIESDQRTLAVLRNDLDLLNSTVHSLREEREIGQSKIGALVEEIDQLNILQEKAKEDKDTASASMVELEKLGAQLSTTEEDLQTSKDSLEKLSRRADEQITTLKTELSQEADEQLNQLRAELLQQSDEQQNSAKVELDTMEKIAADRENEYEVKLAKLSADANEATVALESKLAEAEGRMDAAEHQREEAASNAQALTNDKGQLNQKLEEMSKGLEAARVDLEDSKAQTAAISAESSNSTELAQIKLAATKQAETIRELTEKTQEREPLLESLTTQLEEREHRTTLLEKKNRQLQQEINEHVGDSSAWDMELKLRTSRIAQLEKEISLLKSASMNNESSQPPPADKSMIVLKKQLDQINDQLGEKDADILIMHEKIEKSSTTVKRTRQALQNMLSSGQTDGSTAIHIHDLINALDRI